MKRIVSLTAFCLLCLAAFTQPCNSLRYQDTIFHRVDTSIYYFGTATPFGVLAQPQDLLLDIYEPAGDTLTKRPLIVFEFGGGFTIGWRSEPDIPQFCQYFAKCGYVVASIDYRIGLNPLDTASTVRAFYRGVQDERSAIRYLAANAQQFRIDTNYITLTGTSAGCFCAFAQAFMTDSDRPVQTYGSFLEPDDQLCMDCSGNNDFGLRIPQILAIVNCWGAMLDTSYIEATEHTPVISFHGDQDILVPYVYGYPFQVPVFPRVYGSVPIHERLTNAGIPNVLHTLVGYGHEPELLAPQVNDTIYNYTRPFLFDLLKPVTSPITGDTMLCAGMTGSYSVINTAGSRYCWSLTGNGTIVANNNNSITVLWSDTGIVSVSVREESAIDATGDLQSFQTHVIAHAQSNFSFTTNVLEASFTNLSNSSDNYQWNMGDDSLLTDQSPIIDYQYQGPGTYYVTLIASNHFCADTFTNSFTLDTCPIADITFTLTNHNAFFYSPVTNTLSYYWNFGDGDSAAVGTPNVFHQYPTNGDYLVTLQVRNQLGCKETDTLTVHVAVVSSLSEVNAEDLKIIRTSGEEILVKGLPDFQNKAYQVELFDALGRRIYSGFGSAYNLTVPIGRFAGSIYLLRISCDEQQWLKKSPPY